MCKTLCMYPYSAYMFTGSKNWIREGAVPSKNLPSTAFDRNRNKKQKLLGELRKARALIRDSNKASEGKQSYVLWYFLKVILLTSYMPVADVQ